VILLWRFLDTFAAKRQFRQFATIYLTGHFPESVIFHGGFFQIRETFLARGSIFIRRRFGLPI